MCLYPGRAESSHWAKHLFGDGMTYLTCLLLYLAKLLPSDTAHSALFIAWPLIAPRQAECRDVWQYYIPTVSCVQQGKSDSSIVGSQGLAFSLLTSLPGLSAPSL